MPPFPKPKVDFSYDVDVERRRLRAHRDRRGIPAKSADSLLIGSCNPAAVRFANGAGQASPTADPDHGRAAA